MPLHLNDIETPAVVIDVDRANRNILRAQNFADAHGYKLRPHIKTHKLPHWAKAQIKAGASGITCQKLGEAEVMADAGLDDILLPYNIIGPTKLARLKALHQRITLAVTVDNQLSLQGLSETFNDPTHPLPVLIECDTGMGRCGVQSSQEALALARKISQSPGLKFNGLMTYPPTGGARQAEQWLSQTKALLEADGLRCAVISSGGTPDIWSPHDNSIITEYRPGTYIYLDRYQLAQGVGTEDDCALTVLTTVISHPTPQRAIIDAGSKALTSDLLGMTGYGTVLGTPKALITQLSEEHGIITEGAEELSLGQRLRILPNHACPVSNLFNTVYLVSGETVLAELPVAARGAVT